MSNRLLLLKDEEIKELIKQQEFNVEKSLQLIRSYIFDLKNKDINEIKPPVNFQQNFLMNIALKVSVEYFKNKFNKSNGTVN